MKTSRTTRHEIHIDPTLTLLFLFVQINSSMGMPITLLRNKHNKRCALALTQ